MLTFQAKGYIMNIHSKETYKVKRGKDMTREDVKYFANCLKHNYTIDFNTMERFCNEVIESQNKLQKIEDIIHNSEWGLGKTYRCIAEVLENE